MELFYQNLLLDLILIAAPVAFILFFEKKKLTAKEFGLEPGKPFADLILTAKIFAALLIYSMLLSIALYTFGIADFEPVQEAFQGLAALPLPVLAYIFIARVFVEEFFFRAFLVPRAGIIVSSIVFGAAHFAYGSYAEVIGAIGLGLILAAAYKQYNRLAPNFAAHLLYNVIAALVLVGA